MNYKNDKKIINLKKEYRFFEWMGLAVGIHVDRGSHYRIEFPSTRTKLEFNPAQSRHDSIKKNGSFVHR